MLDELAERNFRRVFDDQSPKKVACVAVGAGEASSMYEGIDSPFVSRQPVCESCVPGVASKGEHHVQHEPSR